MEFEWNAIARDIALDVEKAILPLFGTRKAGEVIGENASGDTTDYVDRVSEDIVLSRLEPLGVNVISEEIGTIDRGSDYTVLVDPVDGSYNFTAGIPVFAFSFAVFRGDKPVYGAIYEFLPKNFYEAISGEGAFLNGRRIHVRKPERGKEALSFYTRGRYTGIIQRVKRVRVLGAIAVELSYLARGSLDGVIDVRNYVRPTDIAAGVLIARESGAIVTDERGGDLEVHLSATDRTNLIAVNDEYLLKIILEELENEP